MCGMTRAEDIAYAAQLGVDAVGLIVYPKSPRGVSIAQAKKILRDIPVFVDVVAVLVNPTALLVEEILQELPIDCLQFHGEEAAEFCRQFNKPYIKAVQVNSTAAIHQCTLAYQDAAAILLETPSASHGGTGKVFAWDLIPDDLAKPFILAGGLDAKNVGLALTQCSPYAVDVCTGVEAAQGIKDHVKMSAFVDALWGKK